MPTLLIFDFDGTIADSVGHIVAVMQATCRKHGIPEPTAAAVKSGLGLSAAQTAANCLPGISPELAQQIGSEYERAYYESQRNYVTHLFPGMLEMLSQLAAQNTLAIATGKSRAGLNAVLANMPELARLFSSLHTASDGPGKPHPAMIEAAIAANKADRTRTLMVGDATFDMQMAKTAGIYAIGVTWGTAQPSALINSGANGIARTVAELKQFISGFIDRQASDRISL